ncbi:hypothetical protein HYPSUDRAFT_39926 [Hypholoma sublateritium FD-334 SS-4]|uniref:Uncharacterized protein n=1 Tax=Hypholoma sublateritium (strain FD-334 SS-4) TaxID=945553 RepID=A0A0D2L8C4_HYPSF|nr:hypothetical protein HYPSUDRAFT_39926 [Hypholoma sublateritium FD-334 SS-4]
MDISCLLNPIPIPICGRSKEKAGSLDTPPAAESQTYHMSGFSAVLSPDAQLVRFDEPTYHRENDTRLTIPVDPKDDIRIFRFFTFPVLAAYSCPLLYSESRRAIRGRGIYATADEDNPSHQYLVNANDCNFFVRRVSESEIGDGLGMYDTQYRGHELRTITDEHEPSKNLTSVTSWPFQWNHQYITFPNGYEEIDEPTVRCERNYYGGYHNLYDNDSDINHLPDLSQPFITQFECDDLTAISPTAERDFDTIHGIIEARAEGEDVCTLDAEEVARRSTASLNGRSVSPPSEGESRSSRPSAGKRSYEHGDETWGQPAKRAKMYAHTPWNSSPGHSSSSLLPDIWGIPYLGESWQSVLYCSGLSPNYKRLLA